MQVPHIKPTRIGVKDLSFRYNNASDWVFHDCSFDLEPGKPYILKGPNGSGKSTLAKLLTGVLRPSEGCITRDGLKVDIWKQPGSLVGYHFQNPDLQLFCSSVAEELRPPQWVPKGFFDVLVRTFGLTHVLASHPLDLPFVLRKRVGLASTVSMVRPWFIFDEPVLAQDKTSAKAVACGPSGSNHSLPFRMV